MHDERIYKNMKQVKTRKERAPNREAEEEGFWTLRTSMLPSMALPVTLASLLATICFSERALAMGFTRWPVAGFMTFSMAK